MELTRAQGFARMDMAQVASATESLGEGRRSLPPTSFGTASPRIRWQGGMVDRQAPRLPAVLSAPTTS